MKKAQKFIVIFSIITLIMSQNTSSRTELKGTILEIKKDLKKDPIAENNQKFSIFTLIDSVFLYKERLDSVCQKTSEEIALLEKQQIKLENRKNKESQKQ